MMGLHEKMMKTNITGSVPLNSILPQFYQLDYNQHILQMQTVDFGFLPVYMNTVMYLAIENKSCKFITAKSSSKISKNIMVITDIIPIKVIVG